MKYIVIVISVLILAGCASNRIKGGKSTYSNSGGSKIDVVQSEDPLKPSTFNNKYKKEFTYSIPAGSKIQMESPVTSTDMGTDIDMGTNTQSSIIILSSNMPVKLIVEESMDTGLGASQKNTVQDIAAKLSSMRPVQYVGIALLLFGIASLVYPPLRLIIGSSTTSIVVAATGLGLIVLPLLIIGNEILILLGGLGIAVGYYFVHRYGKKSGENELMKQWIDKNNNGMKDEGE
jgi:hypothetical protein